MDEHIEQFCAAISGAGITPPREVIADGRLHRFAESGKHGDRAGWYVFHGDGVPAGAFGSWRSGTAIRWSATPAERLTPIQQTEAESRWREAQARAEAERDKERNAAVAQALAHWDSASEAEAGHPYLARKSVKAHGLRQRGDKLLVPVLAPDGILQSLQSISGNGEKRFFPGCAKKGGYHLIGKVADRLLVAEGYATAASLHESTGLPVAVAFDAGNLLPVVAVLRQRFPEAAIVVASDDDWRTDGNPGRAKAEEAARAVNARLVVPDFGGRREPHWTDFNDLAQSAGVEEVCRQVEAATVMDWPDPLPLTSRGALEPYPLDALPDLLRDAVVEVQAFTQAPHALVAGSALSVLSLAGQSLVDVERAPGLSGPCGLYLLTVADSGERKTTADAKFLDPVRAWEVSQAEQAKPAMADFRGALAAWEAVQAGLKGNVQQLAKAGKDTRHAAATLRDHESVKPEIPRYPRLLRVDATPEALAWSLANEWPGGGVISSEGGAVLGAHAMGKDSLMRHLSLLNLLWDGGALPISRRTSDSFTVRGARLTMALQVQNDTLREFISGSGRLARGIGFFARFLLASPASTQGTRAYREPPAAWPALTSYQRRIADLLELPVPVDRSGALTPTLLALAPEARELWRRFHDAVEIELRPHGELAEVRDVAAKAADNAARLAALFHVLEHGPGGMIGPEAMDSAGRLVEWHLGEARRLMGALAVSPELARAVGLRDWVVSRCREQGVDAISTRDVQQFGPNATRRREAMDTALECLADLDWLRIVKEGKARLIRINPKAVIR